MTRSREVYDAFEERSWSALARRSRDKGQEFVVGRRDGPYVWNVEGTRRLLDCTLTGGVHSLGHRNPELLAALRGALDDGLDGGLWVFPTPQMLALQDALTAVAPDPSLNRSVVTLSATASIDLAVQAAALHTGRPHVLAYRHGYHGHAGFAAMVTGSQRKDHRLLRPAEHRGPLLPTLRRSRRDCGIDDPGRCRSHPGAVRLRDVDSGFARLPAWSGGHLPERGALLIVDETRTGLGRSGKFWMCQHSGLVPDILITGKGLSGGLYPASALLTTRAIYDGSINAHRYGFASSMGANDSPASWRARSSSIRSRPELHAGIEALAARFRERFGKLCRNHPELLEPGTILGGIITIGTRTPAIAEAAAASRSPAACYATASRACRQRG